jgi:hypothetical protein
VAEGDAPWALVCEDDAMLGAPGAQIGAAAQGAPECGIVLAGGRAAAWRDAAGVRARCIIRWVLRGTVPSV